MIAGSSRGLGRAVAQRFLAEGANVTVCGRDAATLATTADELRRSVGDDGRVHAMCLDVSRAGEPARLVAETVDVFGGIDVVVPNAGGPPNGGALEIGVDREQWEASFAANFWGSVELANATLPHLTRQRWGRICFIASATVKEPVPGLVLSNVPRSALWSWAKSLASEVAGDGITVTMALPGLHDTDRVAERMTPEKLAARLSTVPAGRMGAPQEFAALVAFLCSEPAAYITGTAVLADGGASRAY